MKFKLSLWVFAFVLLAASLQMAFAIDGGSSNNYSITSSDYLLLARFNQTDNPVIQAAETGQNIKEVALPASSSVVNDEWKGVSDGTKIAVNLSINEDAGVSQNFTCDVYWNGTGAMPFAFESYSGSEGAGLEATTLRNRDPGTGARMQYRDSTSTFQDLTPTTTINASTFYLDRVVFDITNFKSNYSTISVYNDTSGTLQYTTLGTAPFTTWENSITTIKSLQLFIYSAQTIKVPEIACWNWTSPANAYVRPTVPNDTTPPNITGYSDQGSSCTNWNTDPSNPCNTSDTTPALYFNTSELAFCAIGLSNVNYTAMGSSRSCTVGEGQTEHACELTPQDELVYDNSTVFLSCKDASNNQNITSTSGPLKLSITGLEAACRNSIELGIRNSLSSGYTIYTEQKIYARNSANSQSVGVFDKAIKKLSKIWAFNRIGASDSHVNMVNITPVLYTLEFANKTSVNITNQVELLLNSTK